MGEVYRAKDERLKRDVALKFLHTRLADQPSAVARFMREARAASALNHPNIVTIYGAGEDEKAGRFIVMELVRGKTLRALIGKEIDLVTLLGVVTQITEGPGCRSRRGSHSSRHQARKRHDSRRGWRRQDNGFRARSLGTCKEGKYEFRHANRFGHHAWNVTVYVSGAGQR